MLSSKYAPLGVQIAGGEGGSREYEVWKEKKGLKVVKLEHGVPVAVRYLAQRGSMDPLELALYIGWQWVEGTTVSPGRGH